MKIEQIPKDEVLYAWCGESWTKLEEWQHVIPVEMVCHLRALIEAYNNMMMSLLQAEQINNSINYALYDVIL